MRLARLGSGVLNAVLFSLLLSPSALAGDIPPPDEGCGCRVSVPQRSMLGLGIGAAGLALVLLRRRSASSAGRR